MKMQRKKRNKDQNRGENQMGKRKTKSNTSCKKMERNRKITKTNAENVAKKKAQPLLDFGFFLVVEQVFSSPQEGSNDRGQKTQREGKKGCG